MNYLEKQYQIDTVLLLNGNMQPNLYKKIMNLSSATEENELYLY